MKVNVSELKEFKSNAAFIKVNTITPILSYLKFGKGTLTKNNLHSFLIQSIDCKESFLVDERILMNFISYTSSPTIDIKVENKRVIISDGETTVTSPTDDVANYPPNDQSDKEPILLDCDILKSIGIASNLILEDDVLPSKCHVFVGKKSVCGSNGFVAYVDEFEEDLPEMILRKDVCMTITKYDSVKYSDNDSYHFFESGKCKFGFIKPTAPFHDLTPFGVFESESSFTLEKSELIGLNDMVISSVNSKLFPTARIEPTKDNLHFDFNDIDLEITISRDIKMDGKSEGIFNFNPIYMNKVLKAVPDAELTFNKVGDNRYYITGDSGFVALILGLVA